VARRSRQPCPSIRLASGQDTDVFGRRYLVEELVSRRLPDSRRWDTGVEGGRIGSTRTPRTFHLYRRRPADPLAGRGRREGPTRVYSLGPGRNRAEAVPDGRSRDTTAAAAPMGIAFTGVPSRARWSLLGAPGLLAVLHARKLQASLTIGAGWREQELLEVNRLVPYGCVVQPYAGRSGVSELTGMSTIRSGGSETTHHRSPGRWDPRMPAA